MVKKDIKNEKFLKATVLLFIVLLISAFNYRIASSKPLTNSSNDTTDQPVVVYRYQQINSIGDQLKTIDPPTDILSHQIIPFKDDLSCGSASLATILKYSFDLDLSEQSVIKGLMTYGDKETIEKKDAFSFYDMKYFLAAIGYTGNGYIIEGQISPDQFREDDFDNIRNRAIIPIVINGYSHLAVYRTFDNQYVYLGSPLYGNICLTFDDLRKAIIKNSIFIVGKPELTQKQESVKK
jgi:predicted double-glycine peptidase